MAYYRAKEAGYVNGYIYPGEVFEYDGDCPGWAEPVKAPKAEKEGK